MNRENEQIHVNQIHRNTQEGQRIAVEFGDDNALIANNKQFPNNKIVTTKYNFLTWAPKSLLMQFRRAANIYFLLVSILTFMDFSPKQPASMIGTFIFVLVCTMIKELIEDWGRYKQDRASNNRMVWKMMNKNWERVKCWTLMPGDIIKVEKDEEFSADTIILQSTNDNGYCYIDTKNLDGETNLKEKACLEEFKNFNEMELCKIIGTIECEAPNENLSSWKGKITMQNMNCMQTVQSTNSPIYCKLSNIVLKGCVLKNTDYLCGIVIYSGKNTKIMKNSKAARIKMSKVLITMNKLLYSVFLFDIALCLCFGTLNYFWVGKNESKYSYIFPPGKITNDPPALKFIKYFFTFFVAYSHMIPISLYVALEIVKIIQGLLIHFDNEIYDVAIDKPASCRATDLVEELGQVEFIFSDKTGTLTQNIMVLKKIYVHGKVYGSVQVEAPDAPFTINGDVHLVNKLKSLEVDDSDEKRDIEDFLYLLSLCHAVFPEVNKDNKIIYQGASPDDIALVKGAQQLGIEFVKKDFDDIIIENHICNKTSRYEFKIEMPFDSDRKRMSVVVKDKLKNEYTLYSKGADTMMLPRINLDDSETDEVVRVIKVLSKEGLRVLVMGKRLLDENVYLDWEKRYKEARNNGKDECLNAYYEELENSLTFLGCSAIEDKLQDGVSETIYTLLTCNIRVWVLTGDKQDTAEEIAKSCKLINENMFILHLVQDEKETRDKILYYKTEFDINNEENINNSNENKIDPDEISRKIRKKKGQDLSIVIDGYTLEIVLADQELSMYFFHIAIAAKSVVCCRVTPKQKSKVVQLAKSYGKWVTLSIGDGANDVPMIMEAHIGVGIQGKEGTQAVRSADFSIGQFRFLEKLLLIYGRVGYVKISRFICYYFYKNIILVFTDFLFNFQNGFSGQIYFADYLSTLYNAFFTSWPCLFTFSMERDVNLNIVKRFPILYVAGQKNFFFNMKVFWSYILYAIFHGFMCFFISNEGLLNANDSSGTTFNHWYKSTVSFTLVIHIVTYKLLIISDFWNGLNIFSTIFSLLFYYTVVILLCNNSLAFIFQNELAGLLFNIFGFSKFWMVIIIGPFLALLPDITFKQIFYSSWPTPTGYIKQHLRDAEFQSLIFNDESHFEMFNSPEAKRAEKVLKEILKRARDHKMKRRTDLIHTSIPIHIKLDSIIGNQPNYLTLKDNHSRKNKYEINQMSEIEDADHTDLFNMTNDYTALTNNTNLNITNNNLINNRNSDKSIINKDKFSKKPTFTRSEISGPNSNSESKRNLSEVDSEEESVNQRDKHQSLVNDLHEEIIKEYIRAQSKESKQNSFSSMEDEEDSVSSRINQLNKQQTMKKILEDYQQKRSVTKSLELAKNDKSEILQSRKGTHSMEHEIIANSLRDA